MGLLKVVIVCVVFMILFIVLSTLAEAGELSLHTGIGLSGLLGWFTALIVSNIGK